MYRKYKERLKNGETVEDILYEAFATAREAAYRVINEKPYRVQIMGALAMHKGDIAEMKTGEGNFDSYHGRICQCPSWTRCSRNYRQ